jgi:hypothetical protein
MSDTRDGVRRGATQRLPDDDSLRGATPQRTERLRANDPLQYPPDPINADWRSAKMSTRTPRRTSALPRSPQEFQLWLQKGGWRYGVVLAVLVMGVLIAILASARSAQREAGLGFSSNPSIADTVPTVDPAAPIIGQPPADVVSEPEPAPVTSFGAFTVTGTSGQGLLLRPDPSRNGAPITTIPDGARVEQIGADTPGGDFVWRQIRTADGFEGWVAIDFLVPAP